MTQRLESEVRPEIRSILGRLRSRIKRYILLEGAAIVLALLGLAFWLTYGIDLLYFKASNLELPRWFRVVVTLTAVATLTATFMTFIVRRLFRRFRAKALALVLERRFPELDDRLVTAVELAESADEHESELTVSMINRTVDDVVREAAELQLEQVFNKKPLWRALTAAAVLVVSVGFFAGTNAQAMGHWFAAYIALEDEYWDRDYALTARVLVPPGETPRPFRRGDGVDIYRHPRGGDLTLSFVVPDGENAKGAPWKIPEEVRVVYRSNEQSAKGTCSRVGEREFRFQIKRQMDSIDVWVIGGDYTNRRPLRIEVVEPPRVDQIVLDSLYPDYTGLAPLADDGRTPLREETVVHGLQAGLPMETDFVLRADCNKPLIGFRLQFGDAEIAVSRVLDDNEQPTDEFRGEFVLNADYLSMKAGRSEIPPEIVQNYLAEDGTGFQIPFVLSGLDPNGDTPAAVRFRSLGEELVGELGKPFLMPPDSKVRLYLEDADEIISREPVTLTINGIVDQPPVVKTMRGGIGTAVTRTAMLPIKALLADHMGVTDDYGVDHVEFGFKVNDEQEWQQRDLATQVKGRPREFELRMSATQPFERFELLKMDLQIGDSIEVALFAVDGDNLNGPHRTQGESYRFRIVSDEEMLALLFQKELNLRERFERIIEEVKTVHDDVVLHRDNFLRGAELKKNNGDQQELESIAAGVRGCAQQSLFSIQKNLRETTGILDSFRDIREELINNRVDTPQMLARLDDLVIKRLDAVLSDEFPATERTLGRFQLTVENDRNPLNEMNSGVDELELLIGRLEDILNGIQRLETFHEAVQQLRELIIDSKDVQDKIEKLKRDQILKGLKDLGLDSLPESK